MSLRFYFGPSDEELCRRVYEEIIEQSLQNKNTRYLVLVPEQFTMQTQKQLVSMHPSGGILNIDVLSFARLHYRIAEELGQDKMPVLDDTGKNLMLQKAAASLRDDCPVLGGYLNRQGYIQEVKSAVSELMQYGISVKDMDKLIEFSSGRQALAGKLRDLQTIYAGFLQAIEGRFVTTEGELDVLRQNLSRSRNMENSVIVLCGFTGFTPVQNRVLQEMMKVCREVILTLTLGDGENPYVINGEQELFYLTKKTVADLENLAWDAGILRDRKKDVFCEPQKENPEIAFLMRHLFRYDMASYGGKCQSLQLFETTSSKEEVVRIASFIRKLTLDEGYAYRDIAVILGDLEESAAFVEREFKRQNIPCFMDSSKAIRLNPLVEFIKSALDLYLKDFSYDAVMRYLRTGMTDFSPQETDRFEMYLVETGMAGQRKYGKLFVQKTLNMTEEQLQEIQQFQKKLLQDLEPLAFTKEKTVQSFVVGLYEFLVRQKAQEKLARWSSLFEAQGDLVRAKEYVQIYRLVMELLEQIYSLLGEETISPKEFYDILEAGFSEIQVGIIPKQVDRVLVGDMQRTRLRDVKVLFFAGVNDGNIPKNTSKGGILSDIDREFLRQSSLELAPTPRQQMYIQRFYLYMHLTKPADALYLSYVRVGADGKTRRPSYLTAELKGLFPTLETCYPQQWTLLSQVESGEEGMDALAALLCRYAQGTLHGAQKEEFLSLYLAFEDSPQKRDSLRQAAFLEYRDTNLSKLVALALYGHTLRGSVTKLEQFAGCAYRYFLQYGLALEKRREFGLENKDLGTIYHAVIETFSRNLEQNGQTWDSFDEAYAKEEIHKTMEALAATYGATILYSTHRNMYLASQMEKVLLRTVTTIQYQLRAGEFLPSDYELSFRHLDSLGGVPLSLREGETMALDGRIDRVDVAKDGSRLLVKVMDYKSGEHSFDLAALYYGLSLQLVVYMQHALDLEKQKHPECEVEPAAMLYYHITEPSVDSGKELSEEEVQEEILGQLKAMGVVNSDPKVIEKLDCHAGGRSSMVIPVGFKKDNTLTAASKVLTKEQFEVVSRFAGQKILSMGEEILNGRITKDPYELEQKDACTYCDFQSVCGFDAGISGCEKRHLQQMDAQTALDKMKE